MSRVLVVESSPGEAESARLYLQSFGFPTVEVAGLDGALEALSDPAIKLVLFDTTIAGLDVAGAIEALRAPGPMSIVVGAPTAEEGARFVEITGGADAAVVRPYQMSELVTTVAATVQRAARLPGEPGAVLVPLGGGVQLDRAAALVRTPSGSVHLTPREREILLALAEHAGQVVTSGALAGPVSDDGSPAGAIDAHISNLRQELRRHGAHFDVIDSIDGAGFRLNVRAPRRRD